MAEPAPSTGSSLVPKLVLGGLAVFVALTIIGWVVGAIISVLRTLAVIAVVVAVIWALTSARGGD